MGVGTSSPYATLSVDGDLALTGGLYDNTASLGTSGMVLQTTGSGVEWVATSTLGIGGGAGETWFTATAAGDDDSWYNIAYGNGRFVAVSFVGDRVMYSDDGINWATTTAAGDNDSWRGVTYGNGRFVAVGVGGDDRVMYSDDGVTWATTTAAGDDDAWGDVTYGNGRFVAVGYSGDGVMYSEDGVTWATTTPAGNGLWLGITYGNGRFVAVGEYSFLNDVVMYSDDGVTWTAATAAGDNDDWNDVAYGNGLFVAVSYSGDRVMYSSDGVTWTVTTAAGDNDSWHDIAYGNGRFIAVGTGSDRVMYSDDGVTWATTTAAGNDDDWYGIAYANGRFVAVGDSSGAGDSVMYSGTLEESRLAHNNIYQGGMSVFNQLRIGTSTTDTAALYVQGQASIDILNVATNAGTEVLSILESGFVGIGSSTPSSKLTVTADSGQTDGLFTVASSSYAGLFTVDSNGDVTIDNGAFFYDYSANEVSIENLALGPVNFDDDAGKLSWIDMSVTSGSATNTVHSYTAQLDGNELLTIYGQADGQGSVDNLRVLIGTSTDTVLGSSNIPDYSLIVAGGALCVDDNGGANCDDSALTRGQIYAESSSVTAIDVAENYPTKEGEESLGAADIVMLDPLNPVFVKRYDTGEFEDDLEITTTEQATSTVLGTTTEEVKVRHNDDTDFTEERNTPHLLGIVSTKPGLLLGGFANVRFQEERLVPIALTGRVPVKVTGENGPIKVGDRIAPASRPGHGMKADSVYNTVGVALETFNGESSNDRGEVLVFVDLESRAIAEGLTVADLNQQLQITPETGLLASILGYFESIGVWFGESVTKVRNLAAGAFTVGTPEAPSGITLYDEVTGEPYCLSVVGGDVQNRTGTCEEAVLSADSVDPELVDPTPAQEPEPETPSDPDPVPEPPIEPPATTTPTTTPTQPAPTTDETGDSAASTADPITTEPDPEPTPDPVEEEVVTDPTPEEVVEEAVTKPAVEPVLEPEPVEEESAREPEPDPAPAVAEEGDAPAAPPV